MGIKLYVLLWTNNSYYVHKLRCLFTADSSEALLPTTSLPDNETPISPMDGPPWTGTSGKQNDASDGDSYNSETPLLASDVTSSDKGSVPVTQTDETDNAQTTGSTECEESGPPHTEHEQLAAPLHDVLSGSSTKMEDLLDILGSVLSLDVHGLHEMTDADVDHEVHVPIFGSAWELGSMCSINLHTGHDDTGRLESHGLQGRLLSKIFAEKISNSDFDSGIFSQKDFKIASLLDIVKEEQEGEPKRSRGLRNVMMVSVSAMFLHSAVYGLRNLQSSINTEAGIGVISLAALFLMFLVGSFVSPFIVRRFPPRTCLIIATFGHMFNIVANYYPRFYTLTPAAALNGFSSAVFWNAVSSYITEIGIHESISKRKPMSEIVGLYFGIFSLSVQFSMVLGNLISSVVFMVAQNRIAKSQYPVIEPALFNGTDSAYAMVDNTTLTADFPTLVCGAGPCHVETAVSGTPMFDEFDKTFLIGTYTACGLIAMLVIYCLLDRVPDFSPKTFTCRDVARGCADVCRFVVDRRFCLVVPLCLYTIMSTGFVVADVLKVRVI